MLSDKDIKDPTAALMAIPLDRLGLADRSLAALLTVGLLTYGDLHEFIHRFRPDPLNRLPGLSIGESTKVLRVAGDFGYAWIAEWRARQVAALHAEIAAGCQEAEAARAERRGSGADGHQTAQDAPGTIPET